MMYLTPVVYPIPKNGFASYLVGFNPVTPLIETTRAWMTGAQIDSLIPFILVLIVSSLLMILGVGATKISFPHLVARMGS
jgi:lipopolysaccharide transport system permease protein